MSLRGTTVALVLLVLAFRLYGGSLAIDHVTVAGKDLRKMQSALEAIGFKSEYGGAHSNHATEMALVSFPDGSYLELIAISPDADPAAVRKHTWSRQLDSNAGPCAWAVRSSDVEEEARRLRAAGVSVQPPLRNGRTRPDGYRLEWETAQVGTDGNGTFFPFLIRDFTPRNQRAFPSGKPTNTKYSGISRVVIGVQDLDSAVARYRKAFDFPEPRRSEEAGLAARLASFTGTPVTLAAAADSHSWLRQRVAKFGEGPCAFVLGGKNNRGPGISWLDREKLGWPLGVETK